MKLICTNITLNRRTRSKRSVRMHARPLSASVTDSGFTLIEVMVALAVFAVLLVLLSQISTTTFTATRVSHQKLEAREHARQVLDAIGNDLVGLITQNGTPLLIGTSMDNTGAANTQIAFLTQSRGPTASTRCMAVSYRLLNGNLERISEPVSWPGASEIQPVPAQSALAVASGSTVDTVSPGILRFVAVVSLSDGSTVPLIPAPAGNWISPKAQGQTVSPFVALNMSTTTLLRVRSITIAVAVVDSQNYRLLTSAHLTTAGTRLVSPAADSTGSPPRCAMPADLWQDALNSTDTARNLSTLPPPVIATLLFVQKTYTFSP